MSDKDKIRTTDGDYKSVYDIEDPHDECADPNEYYDRISAPDDPEDD